MDDYLKFARMLLGGGRLGDVRILDSRTVDRMTTNQLPEAQRQGLPFGGPPDYWAGLGFGLGLAIPPRRGQLVAFADVGADPTRPHPDRLPPGAPVEAGVKWMAALWFRRPLPGA